LEIQLTWVNQDLYSSDLSKDHDQLRLLVTLDSNFSKALSASCQSPLVFNGDSFSAALSHNLLLFPFPHTQNPLAAFMLPILVCGLGICSLSKLKAAQTGYLVKTFFPFILLREHTRITHGTFKILIADQGCSYGTIVSE
jgi:hypothetical protein